MIGETELNKKAVQLEAKRAKKIVDIKLRF